MSDELKGISVLVTRDQHETALKKRLESLGALVKQIPMIRIAPVKCWDSIDPLIQNKEEVDWVLFSSSNSVRVLLARYADLGVDPQILNQKKIGSIGKATADVLKNNQIQVNLMPDFFQAENFGAALLEVLEPGEKIWVPRGQKGRDYLPDLLRKKGFEVVVSVVYENSLPIENKTELLELLKMKTMQWVSFASPSAVENFFEMISGSGVKIPRIVSIGNTTTKTVQNFGFEVAVTANPQTADGIIQGLMHYYHT